MKPARLVVDNIEVVALVDALPDPVDPTWSFPDVPLAAWADRAKGSLDEHGRFRPNLGAFVLRLPDRTVLVDMGIGPGPNVYLNGLQGQLPDQLAAVGLAFSDIDAVVFTHLHMDHVGWAATRDAEGGTRIACPGTDHYVAEPELAFWSGAPASVGAHHREAFEQSITPLARQGLIKPVRGETEFAPGLSFLATPGHTPGHSSLRIRCASGIIVIAGDVLHCPAQVAEPDWCHRADLSPARARESRKAFLAQAAESEWRIAAGHFRDGWMFGRVERRSEGYRFSPVRGE